MVALSAVACWFIVRTRVPGRSLLEFVSVIPLAVPSIVLGVGVLWAYVALPLPIYGTVGILLIAYMIRVDPLHHAIELHGRPGDQQRTGGKRLRGRRAAQGDVRPRSSCR